MFPMPSGDFPIEEMTSRTHFEVNGGWHSSHSNCVPGTGRQWVGPSPSRPAANLGEPRAYLFCGEHHLYWEHVRTWTLPQASDRICDRRADSLGSQINNTLLLHPTCRPVDRRIQLYSAVLLLPCLAISYDDVLLYI